VHEVGVGKQLCQHHCPVGHVAARFPQLCEEEMAVFTRELGTYAQRLATIARGDAVCTTFIPIDTVPIKQPTEPSTHHLTPRRLVQHS
jgi:predicted ArsR family transcriptional regulator